ncbi:hypothetical protein [Maribacter litoralis]|uniref:hypothetical protein n=1 Tax=Maribacter litoralis TaxID=2059726 RepID=UPI003D29E20E
MEQIHKHLESSELFNQIRLLLFKKNPKIFELIDFDNQEIYKEPLLYAFFTSQNDDSILDQILVAYKKNKNQVARVITDEKGRLYFPNIGWFVTKLKKTPMIFYKESFCLKNEQNQENIEFQFEGLSYINGTKIELLKYPISLLKQFYFNVEGKEINVEITEITKAHYQNVTKAYNILKKYVPDQFDLIEKYAGKCVIFNVDTYQRNSFAHISAQGIGFYNAYQKDYNEVFFVDDIAHQTGHVILNTITYNSEFFFKVDKNTIIDKIQQPDGTVVENRDLLIVFHALYTYYTSFICLNACLINNVFLKQKKHEVLGRMAFYINKCYFDLLLIDNPLNSEINAKRYMTENGLEVLRVIKNKWFEMSEKWSPITQDFNMTNQPYNFTYSKFAELNPLDETVN